MNKWAGLWALVGSLASGCVVATEPGPGPVDEDVAAATAELGSAGVDLTVDQARLASSVEIQTRMIARNSCALVEGCVTGEGRRKLLRFDTLTANIGTEDLVLGRPQENPDSHYSPCHGHYHLDGFADYRLVGPDGVVAAGHKQAFCLLDSMRYLDGAVSSGYTCSYQGISAGWADLYYKSLDCQWIDVTDVPPGTYTLEVAVNPQGTIVESDYTNNVARVQVTISGGGRGRTR